MLVQRQQAGIANAMMLQQMFAIAGIFRRNGVGRAQRFQRAQGDIT
jgi:hypothetical protein